MAKKPTRPMLTVSEVADLLHIHRSTVYRLTRLGALPGGVKVASEWRFMREEIERFARTGDVDRS